MPFNYAAQRLRADRMIARYGSTTGKLRRGGVDRPCTVVEIIYAPRDRNRIVNRVEAQVLISALTPSGAILTPPPDQQEDTLVMFDPEGVEQEFEIVQPVGRLKPATTVVFWDLRVEA
jgi:hypothetical protein